jgi:hypothetical protein
VKEIEAGQLAPREPRTLQQVADEYLAYKTDHGKRPPRLRDAAKAAVPIPKARRLRLLGSGTTSGVTVRMIGSLSIPVIEVKNPPPPAVTS